jgi:hypothetical protein
MPLNFIKLTISLYSPNDDKLREETCSQINKKERKYYFVLNVVKIAFNTLCNEDVLFTKTSTPT